MQIPFSFAQRHGIFIDNDPQGNPTLYCRENVALPIVQEIHRRFPQDFVFDVIADSDFDKQIQKRYSDQSDSSAIASDAEDSLMGMDEVAAALEEPDDLLKNEDDAPIIKMLNAIFSEAIRDKASDIHIEPYEREVQIRFRLNGTLRTMLSSSSKLAPLIVSRIKILARLDIAEKRIPQDGRITVRLGGRSVDLRVSTLPSSFGERVVLRILDKQAEHVGLKELGMNKDLLRKFEGLVNRPHGIVLVTGPTGSGKTTTLYAALGEINHKQRNVMTIEDPVEYNFEGISQTQVNNKAGMTFARGLRAILRQDPDIVLIGEIRDNETAGIAVQASLTGHLVLSTLHTNTAIGAITRLGDMGVEPFLLTATLQGVLAQRLVRRLCKECREPDRIAPDDIRLEGLGIRLPDDAQAYKPKGCDACHHSGFSGRFGLYDLIIMDDDLRQQIHDGNSEIEMEKYIRARQSSLRDTGIQYVLSGDTTIDEVIAVTLR